MRIDAVSSEVSWAQKHSGELLLLPYLDWFERTLSHEKETVELRNRNGLEDIEKMYDSLPERVKQTEYGKKLKDIKLNGLWELKMYINAIREYIRPLH